MPWALTYVHGLGADVMGAVMIRASGGSWMGWL